jgi:hypothetical protein
VTDLRRDNPQTSFPKTPGVEMLAEWGTPKTSPKALGASGGEWVQTWMITDAAPEEIEQRAAQQADQANQQRQAAYVAEADPLFFKSQRGGALHSEWLAKMDEIKTRFPDIVLT